MRWVDDLQSRMITKKVLHVNENITRIQWDDIFFDWEEQKHYHDVAYLQKFAKEIPETYYMLPVPIAGCDIPLMNVRCEITFAHLSDLVECEDGEICSSSNMINCQAFANCPLLILLI